MKVNVFSLILTLVCLSTTAFSQTTPQIDLSPDSVWTQPAPEVTDAEAHNVFTNLSSGETTTQWLRTEVAITPGCRTQICDCNLCYLPTISSKNFTLQGGGSCPIIVHFLNSTGLPAYAVVRLQMWTINGAVSDTITGMYYFNEQLSDTDEPLPAAVASIYPNPATNYVLFKNDTEINEVAIFDLLGRELSRQTYQPGKPVNVADLPTGMYNAVLFDRYGRVFQAIELSKQ